MMQRVAYAVLAALPWIVSCAPAPEIQRVIFLTVDTTRADRIGCYGYESASTPALDRLAAEGVLFEQAVSTVPTTLPSHSTMFTGHYPQDHGVRYNLFHPLPQSEETLAEMLRDAGFRTAGFPASQILSDKFGIRQGFQTWVEPDKKIVAGEEHPIRGAMRDARIGVDMTIEWLDRNAKERAFVWLHFYEAHFAYKPPFPYNDRFREKPYDGEIAYMDSQIGRLMDHLRQDPAWDRTLVIVAGDHGEGLYDHDERWHTILLYETTQRVPLIIAGGGQPAGVRIDEPVSLVDLTPTVADMVGVRPSTEMRGISLRPALEGRELPRRDIYFETMAGSLSYGWQELRGIRFGRFKLIDSTDPELYDLERDPGETTNLAAIDSQRVEDLRQTLKELSEPLDSVEAATSTGAPEMDPQTLAQLESLGYLSGGGGGSAEGAPNPRAMIDLEPELLTAQSAVASKHWDVVLDLGRYTLKRDFSNKWALGAMSDALLAKGEFDDALAHADLFRKFYPDQERGYILTANVYMAREKPEAAYAALQEGIGEGADSEVVRFLSAVAAFDANHDDVCTEEVPRSLAKYDKSGRLMMLRGRCEALEGQTETALETLRVAADLGFTWFDALKDSEDFEKVVALPGFQSLIDGLEEQDG